MGESLLNDFLDGSVGVEVAELVLDDGGRVVSALLHVGEVFGVSGEVNLSEFHASVGELLLGGLAVPTIRQGVDVNHA